MPDTQAIGEHIVPLSDNIGSVCGRTTQRRYTPRRTAQRYRGDEAKSLNVHKVSSEQSPRSGLFRSAVA